MTSFTFIPLCFFSFAFFLSLFLKIGSHPFSHIIWLVLHKRWIVAHTIFSIIITIVVINKMYNWAILMCVFLRSWSVFANVHGQREKHFSLSRSCANTINRKKSRSYKCMAYTRTIHIFNVLNTPHTLADYYSNIWCMCGNCEWEESMVMGKRKWWWKCCEMEKQEILGSHFFHAWVLSSHDLCPFELKAKSIWANIQSKQSNQPTNQFDGKMSNFRYSNFM